MQFLVYKHVLSPRLIDLFHKMEQVWERGLCSQLPITHSQVVQEYRPIQVGREVPGHPGNMRQVHTVQVQTKKVHDHRSNIPCLLLVHSLHQPQTHQLLPGWERTLSGSSASHFACWLTSYPGSSLSCQGVWVRGYSRWYPTGILTLSPRSPRSPGGPVSPIIPFGPFSPASPIKPRLPFAPYTKNNNVPMDTLITY